MQTAQANKALTVQLKTIDYTRKSAADAEKTHAETLSARGAELDRLRKEMKAKKDKAHPEKGN